MHKVSYYGHGEWNPYFLSQSWSGNTPSSIKPLPKMLSLFVSNEVIFMTAFEMVLT